MALDASIKVVGAKQGAFAHQSAIKSRAGTSIITRTTTEIFAPRDVSSGLATGKREYKPIFAQGPIDSSVINYQTAISQNETLTTVVFNFYQTITQGLTQGGAAGTGGEGKPFYTIELTNAVLSSFEFIHPYTRSADADIKHQDIHYKLYFTFQKITITWVDGGKTFADDWLVGSL
jgi:type VI secretion system secreted protein Hcp